MILLLASVSFSLFLSGGCSREPTSAAPKAPPKVTVGHPEEREIVDHDEYNGWLTAPETVDVRARVRGHIDKVHFQDGQIVKKGDPLFTLDPRPFQADVDGAKAQLKVYEAQKVAADKEFVRLRELLGIGGASQSQVEKAEADAGSLDAQIEAAKQQIERNRLDLEYSVITAPIGGRISRALLTEGNLVNAGGSDPLLTTIISVDPMYIYFNVDERALQRYMKMMEEGNPELRKKPLRERKAQFRFGLETDPGCPREAILNFAENKVDRATGTIQLRGEVPNPDAMLVAGSRVRIRFPVSLPYKALLLPDTAILTDQDRKYVLVVGEGSAVRRKDIHPGRLQEDGMRIILPSGGKGEELTKEDWVILVGLQRARINYPVEPLDAENKAVAGPVGSAPPAGASAPESHEAKKD
jgi:RND family efflux transporter MFP subunit